MMTVLGELERTRSHIILGLRQGIGVVVDDGRDEVLSHEDGSHALPVKVWLPHEDTDGL